MRTFNPHWSRLCARSIQMSLRCKRYGARTGRLKRKLRRAGWILPCTPGKIRHLVRTAMIRTPGRPGAGATDHAVLPRLGRTMTSTFSADAEERS